MLSTFFFLLYSLKDKSSIFMKTSNYLNNLWRVLKFFELSVIIKYTLYLPIEIYDPYVLFPQT